MTLGQCVITRHDYLVIAKMGLSKLGVAPVTIRDFVVAPCVREDGILWYAGPIVLFQVEGLRVDETHVIGLSLRRWGSSKVAGINTCSEVSIT